MKATFSNVIVEKIIETQVGSIILSNNHKDDIVKAKVISIGDQCSSDINVNDTVLFNSGEGKEIDGFIVIKESHLLCVIKD